MNDKPRYRRWPRFGLRTLFELIAVVAFILTLIYYRTAGRKDEGRYQFQTDISPTGRVRQKWVIDTQTGQMWRYSYSLNRWQDEGIPPMPKK